MQHRKLKIGALAAVLAIAAPVGVEAAWNGVRLFPCYGVGSSWTLDGLYGPNTQRAVRQFQSEHGLKVDGIAGPETLRALKLPYKRTLRCGMGGRDGSLLARGREPFAVVGRSAAGALPRAVAGDLAGRRLSQAGACGRRRDGNVAAAAGRRLHRIHAGRFGHDAAGVAAKVPGHPQLQGQ